MLSSIQNLSSDTSDQFRKYIYAQIGNNTGLGEQGRQQHGEQQDQVPDMSSSIIGRPKDKMEELIGSRSSVNYYWLNKEPHVISSIRFVDEIIIHY